LGRRLFGARLAHDQAIDHPRRLPDADDALAARAELELGQADPVLEVALRADDPLAVEAGGFMGLDNATAVVARPQLHGTRTFLPDRNVRTGRRRSTHP